LTPHRCLIADDHPAILDAVSRYLDGCEEVEVVGRAASGDQALQLIAEQSPDIAILDVRMPGVSGVEISRRVGGREGGPLVILYTGHAERATLLEALDAGARGFLLKEGPLEDLLRAIRVVSNGGIYVDPALAGTLAGPEATERLRGLSKREREILRLLADGMRNTEISERLGISPLTVKTHVKNAVAKLEAETRTQAVARALRESLID